MTRLLLSTFLLSCSLLIGKLVAEPQTSAVRDKVAEGEYWEWQDGHPLKNTAIAWTLWRASDGYEVDAQLPPNQADAMMAAMAAVLAKNMSRDLRDELE